MLGIFSYHFRVISWSEADCILSAMDSGSIHAIELVFLLLLLFVVVFGFLAQRLRLPYPIVLVIAGTLLGFVPGIPRIKLDPDVVFFVVLPPLLYSAAWLTSWREFSYHLVSILLLAFGLVAFTVLGVAAGAHWLFPGFDWKIGFVLGAVIAPTDALAATSIAKRIGLQKRIVDILEGESLVNDASGLLALEFGVAMVVHNQVPSISGGLLRLTYLIVVGIGVGLISGWIVDRIERQIEHAPIEIAIGIFVPYAVYLTADSIRTSGVLAVVVCGLFLSRKSSEFFSPGVRLQAWAVWDSLTFILNGLVFVIIGLQLPYVLAGIQDYAVATGVVWRPIQRTGDSVTRRLDVPRSISRATHSHPHSSPEEIQTVGARHSHRGLDRHARCHCVGCRDCSSPGAGERSAIRPAQPDHLLGIQRNLGHPGSPGTHATSLGSSSWSGSCARAQSGGGIGPPRNA